MSKTNKEIRILPFNEMEARATDDGKKMIAGYAAKFGKWSHDLGGFREKIHKRAFDEALKADDINTIANKNHNNDLILGRVSNGTLRLSTNSVGLGFEVDMPDTSVGRDTYEEIRRGDLDSCSFAFTVSEDDWKYNEDGTVERTILKVGELYDVAAVVFPAYPDTAVAVRSLEAFKTDTPLEGRAEEPEEEVVEVPEEPKTIDATRQRDIDRKYRLMERIADRNKSADV